MNALRIWAMARKELLHIFRDFRSLYMAVLIPIVLIVIFGYALNLDVEKVKTGVLDLEQSFESRNFLNQLTASRRFVLESTARDSRHLEQMIDSSKIHVGVIIPPDFSRRLKSTQRTHLQVFVDGSNPNRANIIIGYLNGTIRLYNAKLFVESVRRMGMVQAKRPLEHQMRIWFNEELESKNYIIPGLIAVIMMIVGALMTSLIVAREWEQGTMETLLSIPILQREIVLG
jgi:ABC-2 type transport system permease protein